MKQIMLSVLMIVLCWSSIVNASPSEANIDYYSSKNSFSTWENTVYTNPIQAQLYELCRLELGADISKISENNQLVKSDRQLDGDNIVAYDMMFDFSSINEFNFAETVQLEFYQNKLENVRFKFDMNGEQLKNFFIGKWESPASSIAIGDKIRYTWKNGDYEARLLTDGNSGSIVFYYMPYAKNAKKIKRLEYAEYLKTAPEVINRFENLVKSSPQFKESFKQELQKDPEYAQALQAAGMDMSIFN